MNSLNTRKIQETKLLKWNLSLSRDERDRNKTVKHLWNHINFIAYDSYQQKQPFHVTSQ